MSKTNVVLVGRLGKGGEFKPLSTPVHAVKHVYSEVSKHRPPKTLLEVEHSANGNHNPVAHWCYERSMWIAAGALHKQRDSNRLLYMLERDFKKYVDAS